MPGRVIVPALWLSRERQVRVLPRPLMGKPSHRVRWLQQRAKKNKKNAVMRQKEKRKLRRKEMVYLSIFDKLDYMAKTVKLKTVEIAEWSGYKGNFPKESRLEGRWLTAEEAVACINDARDKMMVTRAYESSEAWQWRKPSPVEDREKMIGFYLSAEITDLGEVWVRFIPKDHPNVDLVLPYLKERKDLSALRERAKKHGIMGG